jgi:hypothetical protein
VACAASAWVGEAASGWPAVTVGSPSLGAVVAVSPITAVAATPVVGLSCDVVGLGATAPGGVASSPQALRSQPPAMAPSPVARRLKNCFLVN